MKRDEWRKEGRKREEGEKSEKRKEENSDVLTQSGMYPVLFYSVLSFFLFSLFPLFSPFTQWSDIPVSFQARLCA